MGWGYSSNTDWGGPGFHILQCKKRQQDSRCSKQTCIQTFLLLLQLFPRMVNRPSSYFQTAHHTSFPYLCPKIFHCRKKMTKISFFQTFQVCAEVISTVTGLATTHLRGFSALTHSFIHSYPCCTHANSPSDIQLPTAVFFTNMSAQE